MVYKWVVDCVCTVLPGSVHVHSMRFSTDIRSVKIWWENYNFRLSKGLRRFFYHINEPTCRHACRNGRRGFVHHAS